MLILKVSTVRETRVLSIYLCKANFSNYISEMGAFGQKFPLSQSCVSSACSSLVHDSVTIGTECIYSSNAEIVGIHLLVENI